MKTKSQIPISNFQFLIIGCGSIGKRHLRNLKLLGIKDFVLCDTNKNRLKNIGKGMNISKLYQDYKKAIKENKNISAAVVATPTSLHLPIAMHLAQKGIHIFMEKPLSHNLSGIDKLAKLIKKNHIIFMMAMCYRFNPVLLRLKKLLKEKVIGKIYFVNYFGGHYLPDWHPTADYRREYSARKDLGGGVILTSIHELDNIRWLFGEVKEVKGYNTKLSDLEMDVEDIFAVVLKMEKGFYINAESDFLQRVPQHRVIIIGSKGNIEADIRSGEIRIWTIKTKNWQVIKANYDINTMYVEEMDYFLNYLKKKKSPEIGFSEGVRTLELAMKIKNN